MKFVTVAWAGLSECGRYAVSLAKVGERFLHSAPPSCLGQGRWLKPSALRESREAAEELCREHAKSKP